MVEGGQSDFQRFMMGAKPKNSFSTTPTTPTTIATTPTKSPQKRNPERQYSTIIKAFQGTLQRDWLEVDDNLAAVMRSISNLRDRIYWSSQLLLQHNSKKEDDWQNDARGPRVILLNDDIELALSYEMQQHELMMAGARSLLSSLNQAQEALGRRLAEGMQYDIQLQGEWFERGEVSPPSMMGALEDVYRTLAVELYNKQGAVQSVLDCTNDFLLANDEDMMTADENPRRIARRCCNKWNLVSQIPEVRELMKIYE